MPLEVSNFLDKCKNIQESNIDLAYIIAIGIQNKTKPIIYMHICK